MIIQRRDQMNALGQRMSPFLEIILPENVCDEYLGTLLAQYEHGLSCWSQMLTMD